MKNNNYLNFCAKILLISLISFNNFFFSQTVPDNTRLFQINSIKGSRLSLVETTNNYVYHVGIANYSEVGFDSINYQNVGFDDMFIIKSNVTSGVNSWVKIINSGSKGIISPKYMYVDSSENIFIVGQFSGSITAGSKTVTSTSIADAFIIKIDSSGNPLWVNSFSDVNIAANKIKIDSDATDVFMVFNKNSIVRMSNNNGDVIFSTTYKFLDFNSVALYNNEVYVSGMVRNTSVVAGSETFSDMLNSGFVLKGDKFCNFNASLKFKTINSYANYVDDIDFTSTGKLIISGFSGGNANLESEASTISFTYNPNSSFTYGVYHFSALVDSSLSSVSYYRISSKLSSGYTYLTSSNIYFNSKIIPYGKAENYKNLLYLRTLGVSSSFTNDNSSVTTTSPIIGSTYFNLLLSNDSSGYTTSTYQPVFGGFKMSANGVNHTETIINSRLFTSNTLTTNTNATLWSKTKSTAIGGTVSKQFVRHLNSAKGDLFFTSLVEGKVNFFGRQVKNLTGLYSRYITRLGDNGLPKWFARFHQDSGASELNVSQDFACVDKDDNFLFLANTSGTSSTFYDALGNSIDFQQSSAISSKALIKLDKDGRLLWSKQITPTSATQLSGSVITDKFGDVYLIIANPINASGSYSTIIIDGNTYGNSATANTFLIKLNGITGSIIYTKNYSYQSYSFLPVFDAQNNLYIFSEPVNPSANGYIFDSVTIPTDTYNIDHLMLKFDSAGNVIWGKNFYQNNTTTSYSWPNHVVFDGTNFILNGNLYGSASDSNFLGLDGLQIPKSYSNSYIPFLAKVSIGGNVIWQKALQTSGNSNGNYCNIDLDNLGNIYTYFYFRNNVILNGTELPLDTVKGNKLFTKFDTNGNAVYSKSVDFNQNGYAIMDVIGEDLVNLSNFTKEPNILNYPLNNYNSVSLYVTTFGKVTSKYLTPKKDYLELSNLNIDNKPNNANTFSFDLINNVDWSALSDQTWLNLSFLNLTGKNPSATISGNGDAKITLTAETNNSGFQRTANVLISGTDVASKTIIVTQTGVLGTQQSKTFVMVLYPNPTSEVLNIQSQEKISKAEIYDFTGKLLLQTTVIDKKINVNTLSKGTYFIKLHTEKGIVNSKFIKN